MRQTMTLITHEDPRLPGCYCCRCGFKVRDDEPNFIKMKLMSCDRCGHGKLIRSKDVHKKLREEQQRRSGK